MSICICEWPEGCGGNGTLYGCEECPDDDDFDDDYDDAA